MPITVLIAAAAVAASIPLLYWSVAAARSAPGKGLRGKYQNPFGPTDVRELMLEKGAGERVVKPAIATIAARLRRVAPAGKIEALERQITLAGLWDRWPIERLLVAKFVLAGSGVGVVLLGPWEKSPLLVALGVLLGVVLYYLPDVHVRGRAVERQRLIERELSDVLDQITMSVDAGLGFESALGRAAKAGEGPLAQELTRTLQEMQVGVSRTQALRNLADRSEVSDLRTFVFSVVQSEQYGLPIAKVLRVQAAELRDKRQQRAEEKALRIPVMLLFPLAFFIFPTMFIVLLGPAMIRVFRGLALIVP